jgi:uncharacterized membrane protein
MASVVLGVFDSREHADMAVDDLKEANFNAKDISIVAKDTVVSAEGDGSNVAEGAVSGATTGAVVGGLAGLLIGVGAIAIPGIGGILIGGPLAAAIGLTGAAATTVSGAATGAVAGGLLGALMGLGIPEEDAKVYESRIREGGILIAVPADANSQGEAIRVLEGHGATQVRTVPIKIK